MGSSRVSPLAFRTAAVGPLLALVSACATAGGARSVAGDRDPVVERGPRAQIWTTDESAAGSRIRASFRLEDDAYVMVVNVGRDGYANVIFPESPEDDGFMRGRRTYRLPPFFPGFANNFSGSRYARLYSATNAYDDVYDRYAGYVFIIASWRPMHFKMAEAFGLWDDYRLAAHEERVEPYAVMHRFADALVPGLAHDYTARFARYAAFERRFGRGRSLASCWRYGAGLSYFPWWALQTSGSWWIPVYGFGGCGSSLGLAVVGFPPFDRPVARPPVRPTPRPGVGDTATKPRDPRHPRPPVAGTDSGGKKPTPRGRRVEVAIEDEPIIDVTRDARDRARRGARDADRMGGRTRAESGYDATDGGRRTAEEWRRPDNDRAGRRAETPRDVDRGDDAARTRGSEPRHDTPSRSEPRSEPRPETRPQPAPRNDPPPRSEPAPRTEPAPRAEPRGERPAKPEQRPEHR